MDAEAPRGLLRYFDEMTDPRHHNVQHLLSDMLAIAILAAICGAESWTDVAMFGRAKKKWLATFLRLPRGIPSHDTFGRLFARLDPREFEQCIVNWTAELATCTDHQLIAVDGKTIRRSFDRADEKAAIHMINAWCDTNRLVLGQLATEDKSNEITAMPKLLALLNIQGATVTLDAMHCQKKTVQTIVRGGGDYVIAVKGNQGHLCEQLKITLDEAILLKFDGMPHDHVQTVDADHGRVETRRLWCTSDIDWVPGAAEWMNLNSVAVVESQREVAGGMSIERRYFIGSLPGDDAARWLAAVRGHWSVENRLHWSLDVNDREDDCRIRKGNAAENFSRLRRVALNLLSCEKSVKVGKKAKSKMCGWDHDYLLKVLTGR